MSAQIEQQTQDTLNIDWHARATLTDAEVRKILNLSRTQLWRLRQEGKIGCCKQGVRILYRPHHVAAYLYELERE
jgi:Helix-turn-helix domain